jgi:carbonic anhydrase/acetyltransferase-like protein (isoleucine patch superfamily)
VTGTEAARSVASPSRDTGLGTPRHQGFEVDSGARGNIPCATPVDISTMRTLRRYEEFEDESGRTLRYRRGDTGGLVASGAHVADTAHIGAEAWIDPDARVEAGAYVGDHAWVESGALVGPRAHLARGVHVGRKAVVGAGARVGARVEIGPEARIDEGAVVPEESRVPQGATIIRGQERHTLAA